MEKKNEEKSFDEPLVNTQPTNSQIPSVSVNVDDSQKEKTNEKTEEEVPVNKQNVEIQPPLVKDTTKEEKTKEDKTKKVKMEKDEVEKKESKEKKIIDDDDDDNSVSIKGPIDMDNLSYSQLMEIAIAMQYRTQNKRMNEQQREVETIKIVVDILSSLLPETNTGSFVTPIEKLEQLVTHVGDQLNTFEDVAYILVEKDYKKKRT